ncbi:hypothetical protein FPANT_1428 [Fusarium pseudoanthophilum]|uniref:BTB domain-containing protein n=1 Tax=Fusarium pseudoanthophilum TaxID=48495 RepID=A0A8H5V191_9HYPO|nr:hypothetical protein FPANT_1428 [Fusarium pseudoanthophilum]
MSKDLRMGLLQARDKHEFTDFAFVCGDTRFQAHKVIVCIQSKVFHAACTGPFKESYTNEIDLSEFSVDHVKWLVDFLYTGAYIVPEDSDLDDHIYMFAMGDMYNIEPLAEYAAWQFRCGLPDVLTLEEVLPLIPLVYNSTPDHRHELREELVMFLRSPSPGIKADMKAREWYDDMAVECPEFIKDLFYSYLEISDDSDWSFLSHLKNLSDLTGR